jgi:hypothetical protein
VRVINASTIDDLLAISIDDPETIAAEQRWDAEGGSAAT